MVVDRRVRKAVCRRQVDAAAIGIQIRHLEFVQDVDAAAGAFDMQMVIAERTVLVDKWLVEIVRLERRCSRQNGREQRLVDLIADISKVTERLKRLLRNIKFCGCIDHPANNGKKGGQYGVVQSQLDLISPEPNIDNVLVIALGKVCLAQAVIGRHRLLIFVGQLAIDVQLDGHAAEYNVTEASAKWVPRFIVDNCQSAGVIQRDAVEVQVEAHAPVLHCPGKKVFRLRRQLDIDGGGDIDIPAQAEGIAEGQFRNLVIEDVRQRSAETVQEIQRAYQFVKAQILTQIRILFISVV